MEISRREIRRYLGYGKNEGDEAVNALIEECIRELTAAASPKSISRYIPLSCFLMTGSILPYLRQEAGT